jgi:phosphotransferase system IIB component
VFVYLHFVVSDRIIVIDDQWKIVGGMGVVQSRDRVKGLVGEPRRHPRWWFPEASR